jgi:hypothetical protein
MHLLARPRVAFPAKPPAQDHPAASCTCWLWYMRLIAEPLLCRLMQADAPNQHEENTVRPNNNKQRMVTQHIR